MQPMFELCYFFIRLVYKRYCCEEAQLTSKISAANLLLRYFDGKNLTYPLHSPHLCRALSRRPCGALKPCWPALLPCTPSCGHIQHMAVLPNCFIRYFDGESLTYTPPLYHADRSPFFTPPPQIPPGAG